MQTDPPHSEATEQAVLAVVLDGRHPEAWSIFRDSCPGFEYLFVRNHKLLAVCFDAMEQAGVAIDAQTAATFAESLSFELGLTRITPGAKKSLEDHTGTLLEAIGGRSFIGELASKPGSVRALVDNCESLVNFYKRRELLKIDMSDPDIDGKIAKLSSLQNVTNKNATAASANDSVIKTHDRLNASNEVIISGAFGLETLDKFVPLRTGRLIILAAAPGCGKTSLALMAATNTAKLLGKHSVAFVSLEMSADELEEINLSREAGVPKESLENGRLTRLQREEVAKAQAAIAESDFYIREVADENTDDSICAWIRQKHITSKGKLHLVCIDYLQLIEGKNAKSSEYETITKLTRKLKILSRRLPICIVLLSQMNTAGTRQERDNNGMLKARPEPQLGDLHGSRSIGNDADSVVFIWPNSANNSGPTLQVMLKVAKNRKGREAIFEAEFRRAAGQRFVEITKDVCASENRSVYNRMNADPIDSEDILA